MKAPSQSENLRNTWPIYLIAVLASLILSSWMSIHESVINPDGICYLQTAATISQTGLRAASTLCDQAKSPFYSAMIYGVKYWSHLSFLTSAWVLNGALSLLSVISFIYLVSLLGGNKRQLWLAAAVILFAHEFASVREYIARDHGFWAFYLLSLTYLLQYFRTQHWQYAVLWSASMLIAALFRIEGVMFLLFMPFIAWCFTGRSLIARLRLFLQMNTLTFGLILFAIVFSAKHNSSVPNLARLTEVWAQLTHGLATLTDHFHIAATGLAQHVLSPYAAKDASLVLSLLLIAWYIFSVVASMSLLYAFLALVAWRGRLLPLDKAAKLVLWGYVIVNVVVTGIYLAENLFISKRYLFALALIFMLFVPFALEKIFQQRNQYQIFATVVFVLFALSAFSGIHHFGYSKTYLRGAGDWLAQNVPQQAALYTNDVQVMYYSQHFGNDIFAKSKSFADVATITGGQWRQYDYLALRINQHESANTAVLSEIHLTPMKVFANKRGDKVAIYKIDHQEKTS